LDAEIRWRICRECDHQRTEKTYPDGENLINSKTIQMASKNWRELKEQRKLWADVPQWLCAHHAEKRRGWLDIGFGAGGLLSAVADSGWEAFGIEARGVTIDALKESGLKHINVIEKPEGRYDVISLCDVLEHVEQPIEMLKAIRPHTDLLYVSLPVTDSTIWEAMGDDNPYWNEIEHYHNFSKYSLSEALRLSGFSIIAMRPGSRYVSTIEAIAC
jgi:hypothetical protein